MFLVAIANLEPWVARPDPTRPGEFVASVNTVADPSFFSQCTDEDFGEEVTEWSAAGQFWSNGISSVCSNGLHIEALDRPCRPPDIGSDHVISVVRFDDQSVVLEDITGLLVDPATLEPGTPVDRADRHRSSVRLTPHRATPTRRRLSTAGRRARRRRSSPTRRCRIGRPTMAQISERRIGVERPGERPPLGVDADDRRRVAAQHHDVTGEPTERPTEPASSLDLPDLQRRVRTGVVDAGDHDEIGARAEQPDGRDVAVVGVELDRGATAGRRPTPGRGSRPPRPPVRTDARRDGAVAQRQRRHVDRLATEADVDRDAEWRTAHRRRGSSSTKPSPPPRATSPLSSTATAPTGSALPSMVAPASMLPVDVSQTTVAPVLVWYVTR